MDVEKWFEAHAPIIRRSLQIKTTKKGPDERRVQKIAFRMLADATHEDIEAVLAFVNNRDDRNIASEAKVYELINRACNLLKRTAKINNDHKSRKPARRAMYAGGNPNLLPLNSPGGLVGKVEEDKVDSGDSEDPLREAQ